MSTDLLVPISNQHVTEYTGERFELEQRMAKLFATSGLFSDIKGASPEQAIAQAYVKIAMGNSMGFSPAESMSGIDIIQGRLSVGSQLRAARMQRAGYSWRIDKLDNEGCELTIFAGARELGKAAFGAEDAKSGGLSNKDNYKKDPSSMYFARAITRAQRRYAPGVLSLDVMSTEEAQDYPEPGSVGIAAATDAKTEELGAKLKAKREKTEVKPEVKPETVNTNQTVSVTVDPAAPLPPGLTLKDGVISGTPTQAGTFGPIAVSPIMPEPAAPATADNPWPKRATDTFLMTLGPDLFNEVMEKTLGTSSLAAINPGNYKKLWEAMGAAKARMAVPVGPDAPNSITSPELAPDVKGGLF